MVIKAICGFREDQEHSIPMEEAHKLYRIFQFPEERAIFKNGLALIGADVRRIVPDYNATMNWHPSHKLDSDDWNEIRSLGVDRKLREEMTEAQEVARLSQPQHLALPLSEAKKVLLKIEAPQK